MKELPLHSRFWSKVTKYGNEACWIWNGTLVDGYGKFWLRGKLESAHRLTYEAKYGPIPDDMDLHHVVCETRRCVNPDHTTPITKEQHAKITRSKLTCKRGHPLWGDNYNPKTRQCRTCYREYDRNRKRAKR